MESYKGNGGLKKGYLAPQRCPPYVIDGTAITRLVVVSVLASRIGP